MSAQFSEGKMDGLLGLGFRKLNTVRTNGKSDPQLTPIDNMIAQEEIPPEAELFTSAMYSNRDEDDRSFYTFGWIDEDLVKASGEEIAWTDIDMTEGFWMFPSETATIDGEKISLEGNKAIADTGTTLALVSDQVCDALYAKIKGAKYDEEFQGWLIPRNIQVEDLPKLSIAVGGKEFLVQQEDLIFAPANKRFWYGGVQSRGENPFDILGDVFLKSIYAVSLAPSASDGGTTSVTDCGRRFGTRATPASVPCPRSKRSSRRQSTTWVLCPRRTATSWASRMLTGIFPPSFPE
jgi:hypothetical protein